MWRGTGGRKLGEKQAEGVREGGRREGRKWDSRGGKKWEKKGKIMQHCAIFHNGKNAKRWEPTNTGQKLGVKGTGSGRFKPPCPPVPLGGVGGRGVQGRVQMFLNSELYQ